MVLDGTPLGQAIEWIDAEAERTPIGFSVNFVHTRVLKVAGSIAPRRARGVRNGRRAASSVLSGATEGASLPCRSKHQVREATE